MNHISLKNGQAKLDGLQMDVGESAMDFYKKMGTVYPKFFKMDLLSKWAWLAAEALLKMPDRAWRFEGIDKTKIAVVLYTRDGCLEADKAFLESMKTIASPALFVYTLPNIMLGEICIRHGFQGEQLCEVVEEWDVEEAAFYVKDLLEYRSMEACLFGFVDATAAEQTVQLFWVEKSEANNLNTEKLRHMCDL
ncbi:MAG: hypothetical protein ABI378_15110 [Chitinophagaceae bacterium]